MDVYGRCIYSPWAYKPLITGGGTTLYKDDLCTVHVWHTALKYEVHEHARIHHSISLANWSLGNAFIDVARASGKTAQLCEGRNCSTLQVGISSVLGRLRAAGGKDGLNRISYQTWHCRLVVLGHCRWKRTWLCWSTSCLLWNKLPRTSHYSWTWSCEF